MIMGMTCSYPLKLNKIKRYEKDNTNFINVFNINN